LYTVQKSVPLREVLLGGEKAAHSWRAVSNRFLKYAMVGTATLRLQQI
jgi:hypothetical protein